MGRGEISHHDRTDPLTGQLDWAGLGWVETGSWGNENENEKKNYKQTITKRTE